MTQCAALKRNGEQCSRDTVQGSRYCRQHLSQKRIWRVGILSGCMGTLVAACVAIVGVAGDITGVLGFLGITAPSLLEPSSTSTLTSLTLQSPPGPAQSAKWCTVVLPSYDPLELRCGKVTKTPLVSFDAGNVIDCLPEGARIEVVEAVAGTLSPFYRISSYHFDGRPVVVTRIEAGSPAEEVGLRTADVLFEIDGVPIRYESLANYIDAHVGQNVTLLVRRGEEEITVGIIPRVSPPEGQGPIGFRLHEGTLIEGHGGYVSTMMVSCIE